MADRELTVDEKTGTLLQHKYQGFGARILQTEAGGYIVYDYLEERNKFVPYSEVGNWYVIE